MKYTITNIDENAGTAFAWQATQSDRPDALGWGATPNLALDDLRWFVTSFPVEPSHGA